MILQRYLTMDQRKENSKKGLNETDECETDYSITLDYPQNLPVQWSQNNDYHCFRQWEGKASVTLSNFCCTLCRNLLPNKLQEKIVTYPATKINSYNFLLPQSLRQVKGGSTFPNDSCDAETDIFYVLRGVFPVNCVATFSEVSEWTNRASPPRCLSLFVSITQTDTNLSTLILICYRFLKLG